MKCPKCGAEVKEGLAACSVCFAPLTGEEAERVAKIAKETPTPSPQPRPRQEAVRSGGRGGGGIVAGILVLILLAVIGGAGWYYLIYLRSPQYGAKVFLEAMKAKDYDKIYQACVWTGPFSSYVTSGQQLRQGFEMAERLTGQPITFLDSYKIKNVSRQENRATVKVEVTSKGKNSDMDVIMVKQDDGKWKCDFFATFKPFIEKAMQSMQRSLPGLRLGR